MDLEHGENGQQIEETELEEASGGAADASDQIHATVVFRYCSRCKKTTASMPGGKRCSECNKKY